MNEWVGDASAAMAMLYAEPGAAVVGAALRQGTMLISAVNEAEVLTKMIERGQPIGGQQNCSAL